MRERLKTNVASYVAMVKNEILTLKGGRRKRIESTKADLQEKRHLGSFEISVLIHIHSFKKLKDAYSLKGKL